jgi:colanic acid/amylovoran biosynthesis glycosyltransferase
MAPIKIAYIMSRFPHLPETFILREMNVLDGNGWDIKLYPLIIQKQSVVHEEAKSWIGRANTPSSKDIIRTNLAFLFKRPGLFLSLIMEIFKWNIQSPSFLIRAIYLFPKAVWMASKMQRQGIVHIHAHYATHPALVAWIINRITGITYSITIHAHDIFENKTMLAPKLRNARAVVAISEFNRNYLYEAVGTWIDEKIHVIHCGVDPSFYHPRQPASRFPKKPFEILSIGSLQPYKGFPYLLDACAILRQRGILFRCKIVGGGGLYKRLNTQINALNLHEYVELLGPKTQREVAILLSTADCYVQPSIITETGKMEGIPVALMEAMVNGLPVVASRLSGIPELVRDRETGLLAQPGNPQQLANALMEIHANEPFARDLAEKGRELVLREFNLTENALRLSHLLTKCINTKN